MTVEHILSIVGALVPVFSALSSFVNHLVRTKQASGEPVSPTLLGVGAMLNVASVNVDKAVQMAKAVKDAKAGLAAAPAAPAVEAPKADEPVKVE